MKVCHNAKDNLLKKHVAINERVFTGIIVHPITLHEFKGFMAELMYEVHVATTKDAHVIRGNRLLFQPVFNVFGKFYSGFLQDSIHHPFVIGCAYFPVLSNQRCNDNFLGYWLS